MTAYEVVAARVMREDRETAAARRASLDAWLGDADALLGRLEPWNAAGQRTLPADARDEIGQLHARLARLGGDARGFTGFRPSEPRHQVKRGDDVQRAVTYVLDILEAEALRLKWPAFHPEADDLDEVVEA